MSNVNNEIRWANERSSSESLAERALEKCKKREKKLIEQGYRYYQIGRITHVLIPCDEHGHPTKEGQEKIRIMKKHLGI